MGKKPENKPDKKRPRPLLFPTENKSLSESNIGLVLGTKVTIGTPSNRYFQYIHQSLNFVDLTLPDLEKLLPVQGFHAVVTGFLKMGSGQHIAVLQLKTKQPSLLEFQKLFAHNNEALASGELQIVKQ